MRKLTFLTLFLVFVNAEFSTSMFLKNIKSIKKMHISYEDAHENKKRLTVDMHNKMIADELIIFSEEKRHTSLRKIELAIPDQIISIEIEYINKNNKSMSKFMGISLNDRVIKGDNLYVYQDKDFNHKDSVKEVNFSSLFKKEKNPSKTTKQPIARKSVKYKNTKMHNYLEVKHSDKGNYIDIDITNCGNKTFDICDEVEKPLIVGNDRKVVFYFDIKKEHTKMKNVSKNIKRIEVGYDLAREHSTHLVIEVNKKIHKVEKMYNKNGTFISSKTTNFKTNHQQISYRIHIK